MRASLGILRRGRWRPFLGTLLRIGGSISMETPAFPWERGVKRGLRLADDMDDVGELDALAVRHEGDLHRVPLPGVRIVEGRVGGALREAGHDLVADPPHVQGLYGVGARFVPHER